MDRCEDYYEELAEVSNDLACIVTELRMLQTYLCVLISMQESYGVLDDQIRTKIELNLRKL